MMIIGILVALVIARGMVFPRGTHLLAKMWAQLSLTVEFVEKGWYKS